MTKAEILSQIKKAEEDARSMTLKAKEEKSKNIMEAKIKARELINAAEKEIEQKEEHIIAKTKEKIKSDKENMLKDGHTAAESIKKKADQNIAKATEYLIEQFERTIHA